MKKQYRLIPLLTILLVTTVWMGTYLISGECYDTQICQNYAFLVCLNFCLGWNSTCSDVQLTGTFCAPGDYICYSWWLVRCSDGWHWKKYGPCNEPITYCFS